MDPRLRDGRCGRGTLPRGQRRFGIKGLIAAVALAVAGPGATYAAAPFSCGGFALQGGAELLCSHTDRKAPAQICTFSWALTTMTGTLSVASGSFLLEPGLSNVTVYQGSGFSGQMSPPIVLCQGKRSG